MLDVDNVGCLSHSPSPRFFGPRQVQKLLELEREASEALDPKEAGHQRDHWRLKHEIMGNMWKIVDDI